MIIKHIAIKHIAIKHIAIIQHLMFPVHKERVRPDFLAFPVGN